jgi:Mg-chelatase subunit ChlD
MHSAFAALSRRGPPDARSNDRSAPQARPRSAHGTDAGGKQVVARAALLLAVLGANGCSGQSDSRSSATGGAGGSGGEGNGGGAGNVGPGGSGPIIVHDAGPRDPDAACQQFEVRFVPKVPTVFVLVDRSGSMFTPDPATMTAAWEPLKTGVLQVIQALQHDIRFGFGAFTGEQNSTCPLFDRVDANVDNYEKIATLYRSLKQPTKGETPTMRVLSQVKDILARDPTDGEKLILFVTDGEPDYCADGNALCPVDSVIAQLQQLAKAGFKTFVFGLKSAQSDISESTLQGFANAGAGLAVAVPVNSVDDIYNQCFNGGDPNGMGWKQEFLTANVPGAKSLATYASPGGTARVFRPDLSDPRRTDDLVKQLSDVISGAKSCIFELEGKIKVNLDALGAAQVFVQGVPVPLSNVDGWRMNSATQLELVGGACANWRRPENTVIKFHFPCDSIIIIK